MSSIKTIPSLNGIRAICIILVVGAHAHHSPNFPSGLRPVWDYIFNGGLGVIVFFTLSGFLITHLLMKEKERTQTISLKNFYMRRLLRIFPVYYLFLAVLFLLQVFHISGFSTCQWLTSLTYTKNFGCGSWMDGHLWSLAVEEQFYFIWPPVFAYFSHKNRLWFSVICILLSPALRAISYLYFNKGFTDFSFFTNMDCLMIGCIAALYLPVLLKIIGSYRQNLIRAACLLVILSAWYLQLHFIAGFILLPLGKTLFSIASVTLIISYGFFPDGFGYRFLNHRLVNYLGILSYSIYVWQQVFFAPELGLFSELPFNYLFILVTAMISYHLVEKPILKLKEKFTTNKKTVVEKEPMECPPVVLVKKEVV